MAGKLTRRDLLRIGAGGVAAGVWGAAGQEQEPDPRALKRRLLAEALYLYAELGPYLRLGLDSELMWRAYLNEAGSLLLDGDLDKAKGSISSALDRLTADNGQRGPRESSLVASAVELLEVIERAHEAAPIDERLFDVALLDGYFREYLRSIGQRETPLRVAACVAAAWPVYVATDEGDGEDSVDAGEQRGRLLALAWQVVPGGPVPPTVQSGHSPTRRFWKRMPKPNKGMKSTEEAPGHGH